MKPRLTVRLLIAMDEALASRLAGEIDIEGYADSPRREDYEAAELWIYRELQRRKNAKS